MVDIRFEQDTPRQNFQARNSRLTQFFINKSFGLIQTPGQAAVAQVIVAIGLFIFAGVMFSSGGQTKVNPTPPQNLIDAPQPTRPLVL
jgi:hypothetical protein